MAEDQPTIEELQEQILDLKSVTESMEKLSQDNENIKHQLDQARALNTKFLSQIATGPEKQEEEVVQDNSFNSILSEAIGRVLPKIRAENGGKK